MCIYIYIYIYAYMYLCMYVYMIVEKKGSINDMLHYIMIFQGGFVIPGQLVCNLMREIVITRFDIIRILNFYKS